MEQGWTVTIDAEAVPRLSDSTVIEVVDRLTHAGGAVSIDPAGTRISITLSVSPATGLTPSKAAVLGERQVLDMADDLGVGLRPVAVEAMTFAEHDARLAEPLIPQLVGVSEIANLLGVSRQRASELQSLAGFPEPVSCLAAGPIWTRSSVGNFERSWERKPGRPAKNTRRQSA